MNADSKPFNRRLYLARRRRFASDWQNVNFLKQEAAARIADKLHDIKRHFPLALDLGSHAGELAHAIAAKTDRVIRADSIEAFHPDFICDEEWLPFTDNSFDLIVSALSLHHVNDLPGTLLQVQRCLKPDGLFIATLPGVNTLRQLRESIVNAAMQHNFPLSPRLSPMIEVRDGGALLQRAGFALPVVDSDMVTVEYASASRLFEDIRQMGESNVLHSQHKGLASRHQFAAIMDYYEQHFRKDGSLTATVEFITLTGWKPHNSQQKPSARGSAKHALKEVLK